MKSKVILITLLLAISTLLLAQDESSTKEKKVWYGIKFGLDASTSTASLEDLQSQLQGNYQVGLFVQLGKKLYFQPEIYYASYTTSDSAEPIKYVKAPLLVGLQILDIGLVSLHINGGSTFTKPLSDTTTSGSFKWTLGVGANVLGFINADIRYIFQNNIDPSEVEDLITNGGMVNLTVGLRL